MRTSIDELATNRTILNGYDYNLQAWVLGGVIQDCNHPAEMKAEHCCNSHRLAGRRVTETNGAEVRP